MLSDRERVKLREIEQQLEQEDRRLALVMSNLRPPGMPRWAYDMTIVISGVLALVCFVLPGGAAGAGTVAAAVGAAVFWARRQRFPRRSRN